MNDLLGVRGDDCESITSNSPIPGTPIEIESDLRHTKTPNSTHNIPNNVVKGSSPFQEKHTDSDASSKLDNSSVNEDSTEYTKSLLVNQIPGNQYNGNMCAYYQLELYKRNKNIFTCKFINICLVYQFYLVGIGEP